MRKSKSKDKQIRELEDKKTVWKIIGIMFFVITIIIVVFSVLDNNKIYSLKEQLQLCQEKVPEGTIWQVKTYCIIEIRGVNLEVYSTANFTDYEFYEEFLKHYKNGLPENCEVLE